MTRCRELWNEALPPYPLKEINALRRAADPRLFEVCACFRLYRYLHGFSTPEAALLGDFCFGRFTHYLAALDSAALTDVFAARLREEALCDGEFENYLDFVYTLNQFL